jgi:hypothetical protein
MSLNDWAALIVSSITIIAALVAAIRYLVRNYLSELKPDGNGGHNLEGRVKRIEDKLDTLYTILISRK